MVISDKSLECLTSLTFRQFETELNWHALRQLAVKSRDPDESPRCLSSSRSPGRKRHSLGYIGGVKINQYESFALPHLRADSPELRFNS
jgi:hypothetical protein